MYLRLFDLKKALNSKHENLTCPNARDMDAFATKPN